jgi:glucosyl-3-phosphoglycerate phosphatase
MTRRITLVRHAETEANVAGGWQGHRDSPITERGEAQIEALRGRLDDAALLVCSDLDRAMVTAAAIGDAESDPAWRELDFGDWEGMTPAEIRIHYPETFAAMVGGGDFLPEGGERLSEFNARILAALDGIADRLDDGEAAIVVTHGGVIMRLAAAVLGTPDAGVLALPANTSATTITIEDGRRPEVTVYNDAFHIPAGEGTIPGRRVLLYRHAETEANREHRWHGRGETPLTDTGRQQAADLAGSAVGLAHIAASPLSRARLTAEAVAAAQGSEVGVVDGLTEIHFGAWEGLTVDEIRAIDTEAFERIFESGIDEARGATGETFGEAGTRMAETIDGLLAVTPADPIGVFTHGGVSRAYVTQLLGIGFAERHALPVLRNTAHAEVRFEPRRTRLVSYNVAPHLEP